MSISVDDKFLDSAVSADELAADARAGLTAMPKTLPPRWFYDARGSELFEQITELPEYYPTRTERSILAERADEIAAAAPVQTVVELGSGSSTKTRLLLDAWHRTGALQRIITLDVSITRADRGRRRAAAALSRCRVAAGAGRLHAAPGRSGHGRSARPWSSSARPSATLTRRQRADFLPMTRAALRPEDVLLLGTDLVKSEDVLVPAYDDAAGVTAQFNLNVLRVLNTQLDGDIPIEDFVHRAVWNAEAERIEMRLRAEREVVVRLSAIDLTVHFDRGEELLTEISSKFRRDGITAELAQAGLTHAELVDRP